MPLSVVVSTPDNAALGTPEKLEPPKLGRETLPRPMAAEVDYAGEGDGEKWEKFEVVHHTAQKSEQLTDDARLSLSRVPG